MKRVALLLLYPLLVAGLVATAIRYLTCVALNPTKAWSIALMIDETCNVDANGRINETISERAAKAMFNRRRWGCLLCWVLDRIQPNHCENALADDDTR